MDHIVTYIVGYGCISSAGVGVEKYWEGLLRGLDHSHPIDSKDWPIKPTISPFTCLMEDRPGKLPIRTYLVNQLLRAWEELRENLSRDLHPEDLGELGLIFASTKGCIEDFIWDPRPEDLRIDPLTPILKGFIEGAELRPKRSLCVSNACASSHSAVYLAHRWLEKKSVQSVLILAADFLGPFVVNGFQSLKALSETKNRPFAKDRDGLQLGEAAAAILLSQKISGRFLLKNTQLFNEGYGLTRPDPNGQGLNQIYRSFDPEKSLPDLLIAHGTGTLHNDVAEDCVIAATFGAGKRGPPVTNTKWSIGHTLGASGAMDLIAACESIKNQTCFEIANTFEIDPRFQANYLTKNSQHLFPERIYSVIVNSLGFGGITGALEISKSPS
jgi:hypothetical protein